MKLFTHNCMTSAILKGVKVGFPLKIEVSAKLSAVMPQCIIFNTLFHLVSQAVKVEEVSSEFNKSFVLKMLPRIDYGALYAAAAQVSTTFRKSPSAWR